MTDETAKEEAPLAPRQEVVAFAHLMEIHLRERAKEFGVNGWRGTHREVHYNKMKESMREYRDACQRKDFVGAETALADIAVRSMAIFDIFVFFREEFAKQGWMVMNATVSPAPEHPAPETGSSPSTPPTTESVPAEQAS